MLYGPVTHLVCTVFIRARKEHFRNTQHCRHPKILITQQPTIAAKYLYFTQWVRIYCVSISMHHCKLQLAQCYADGVGIQRNVCDKRLILFAAAVTFVYWLRFWIVLLYVIDALAFTRMLRNIAHSISELLVFCMCGVCYYFSCTLFRASYCILNQCRKRVSWCISILLNLVYCRAKE